jgi:hypothetical protein
VRRVHRRALAWLARSKLLGVSSIEDASQEPSTQTSLDACAAIAMQRGAVRGLRDDPESEQEGDGLEAPPRQAGAVERDGFNLHASVSIPANDDRGRERLMRYGARPPLALDRLRRLPDGRIAYRIKRLRDGRAKHRVMTPLEFLARLAAIVPTPRYPLLLAYRARRGGGRMSFRSGVRFNRSSRKSRNARTFGSDAFSFAKSA